ncbi:YppG-like protein [Lentibacillus persicus]|uniref:YppG-like protein n=1 Tax=Lentibacillus persicus TaxID=640948 RepID=A0A1I1ZXT7_9BACI|nr:YppG family protein [Lentibacillus persicus]SFE35300.1 YppG-like protein [Lentibacillus persicus]
MIQKPGPFLSSANLFSAYNPQTINTRYDAHNLTAFEVFAKPKQPVYGPFPHYPGISAPQPSPQANLLKYFQNQDGQIDIEKMLSTAGQVVNTVQQVSPVVKDVGQLMKNLR